MIMFNTLRTFFLLLFTEFHVLSGISSVYLTKHKYLVEQIKYLLELKKNVIHRTKLSLAIELHFLVNANKYLFRSPETQGLVESSRFSLTLPNLFLSVALLGNFVLFDQTMNFANDLTNNQREVHCLIL